MDWVESSPESETSQAPFQASSHVSEITTQSSSNGSVSEHVNKQPRLEKFDELPQAPFLGLTPTGSSDSPLPRINSDFLLLSTTIESIYLWDSDLVKVADLLDIAPPSSNHRFDGMSCLSMTYYLPELSVALLASQGIPPRSFHFVLAELISARLDCWVHQCEVLMCYTRRGYCYDRSPLDRPRYGSLSN